MFFLIVSFYFTVCLSFIYTVFFTYIRYYDNMLHKNSYQCKIPIVPEEGWFGQAKYSTPSENYPTLCRFLLLYSSFMREADKITVEPTYTSRITVSVARSILVVKFHISFDLFEYRKYSFSLAIVA